MHFCVTYWKYEILLVFASSERKKNYRKWAFLIQVPLDTCFVLNEYLQVG